jgi:hypothetical protein
LKLSHVILGAIALTIALKLWRGLVRPRVAAWQAARRLRSPDRPQPFAQGLPWLAVHARDTRRIIAALGLASPRPANWSTGLGQVQGAAGAGLVFVSPPVSGWTLIAGLSLPGPVGRRFVDKCTPLLQSLSQQFGEVQYFQADAQIDLYAWAKVADGRILRAFAIGDEGIIWNKGKLSKDERGLGLKLFELRGVDGGSGASAVGDLFAYPTEEHVGRLAAKWSLDPQALGRSKELSSGYLAEAPGAWRPERMARAAGVRRGAAG